MFREKGGSDKENYADRRVVSYSCIPYFFIFSYSVE